MSVEAAPSRLTPPPVAPTIARGRAGVQLAAVGGVAFVAAYVAVLFRAASVAPYDQWAALVVGPVLVLATVPLARRIRRVEGARMGRLIMVAVVVKLVASLVRYAVAFDVYDGVADSAAYVEAGARLAPLYRQLLFASDLGKPLIGTGAVRMLTGLVFTVTGPTTLGGFLVFAWLGFLGQYAFFRAFRIGVPDGDARRYALLVFFLPSLLFWPSSIGKESWMVLTLGLTAAGAARLVTRHRGATLRLLLGLAGAALVRPHMAVLVAGAVGIAFLLRRAGDPVTPTAPIGKVVGSVVLAVACVVLLVRTEQFFNVQGQGIGGVDAVLTRTAGQTGQGGSEFEAVRVRSPLQLPQALVTVLFRPFPFEARNLQMLIASIEGLGLLALFAASSERFRALPRRLLAEPYLMFAAIYTLLFVTVFSTFGNFGLLTRQRAQLLPFVLVFLATAVSSRPPPRWRARNHAPLSKVHS